MEAAADYLGSYPAEAMLQVENAWRLCGEWLESAMGSEEAHRARVYAARITKLPTVRSSLAQLDVSWHGLQEHDKLLMELLWFVLVCMVASVLIELLRELLIGCVMPNSYHIHIDGVVEVCVTSGTTSAISQVADGASHFRKRLGYDEDAHTASCVLLSKDTHRVVVQHRGALLEAYPFLSEHLPREACRLQYCIVPDVDAVEQALPPEQLLAPCARHPTTRVHELWAKDPLGNVSCYAQEWR
eukprot:TRINITY_DN66854_c0_g1_i1.p1 TRINITY_DN66854_c0_g1~~TRINITY_DN66854_c0_g1_i1.p1  ORF type:complete len:243 (+),score=78.31 TRINITY_DN66854_c0_g1_i1:212-940(+)